jgi:hypothetical protein
VANSEKTSASKHLKPCMRGNDECAIDCCIDLTPAQANAMHAFYQGRGDEVRSGPHLAALASLGLIARTGAHGAYEPTEHARNVMMARGVNYWTQFSSDTNTEKSK